MSRRPPASSSSTSRPAPDRRRVARGMGGETRGGVRWSGAGRKGEKGVGVTDGAFPPATSLSRSHGEGHSLDEPSGCALRTKPGAASVALVESGGCPAVFSRAVALAEERGQLPARPGVYLFKGEDGAILYVGKARVLRDRVPSFFQACRTTDV